MVGWTGTLERIERYVGQPVIRGVQIAVALILLETGVHLGLDGLPLALGATAVAGIVVEAGYQRVSALVVLCIGVMLTDEDRLPSEVSGTDEPREMAYKFSPLSLVGKSMPIVLAVKPVIESSVWEENFSHQYHRTIRRLVRRAKEFVTIDLVLADWGFESLQVY
ncbi:hypothetical protein [Halocatena salina]|uniref:Uncharacterized protein n=1 Tax=Halocatena salina TaxID=2934340 RepID=A0A8U0A6R3_9EURY|nr:hypothetical protein [Halocatena salina]UPM44871.1 hypothetical protein MW046_15935 [Halocatena salina]